MRSVVLATRAIDDVPTAVIALVTLAVLWRLEIPEPFVVVATAAIGLVTWSPARGA